MKQTHPSVRAGAAFVAWNKEALCETGKASKRYFWRLSRIADKIGGRLSICRCLPRSVLFLINVLLGRPY